VGCVEGPPHRDGEAHDRYDSGCEADERNAQSSAGQRLFGVLQNPETAGELAGFPG